MTNLIDKSYFYKLAEQNPEDLCKRSLCKYNARKKIYTLSVWGNEYDIHTLERKIECISNHYEGPHEYFNLFIIYYLLQVKNIKIKGEWISEKDLPGGPTFFRGPHKIPTYLISDRYGNRIEAFRRRCEQLHGIAVNMADAAYHFSIAPHIPVAVLYWIGDEEFPPEAKILYDRTIARHLSLDIIFALSIEICTRIGKEPNKHAHN